MPVSAFTPEACAAAQLQRVSSVHWGQMILSYQGATLQDPLAMAPLELGRVMGKQGFKGPPKGLLVGLLAESVA